MADKDTTKVVISEQDQNELVKLLEQFKTTILAHEARITGLEAAVSFLTRKSAKNKLITPPGVRMGVPKG